MEGKIFVLQLSGAKLSLLGSVIESQKAALSALAIDVQQQVNAQVAAAQKAAAEAEKTAQAKPEPQRNGRPRTAKRGAKQD